jgi:glycosyltransferase involved in cell wall biosynthesis
MQILWLSNKVLSEQDNSATGTWLDAMAQGLVRSGEVELGNIAQGSVERTTRQDYGPIRQWIVPSSAKLGRDGLPSLKTVDAIIKATEEFSPDLIHVWGTEGFWGLLTARKLVRRLALLEMQGLKGAIAQVFHGGLSSREQLACVGPKELLLQSSIFQGRRRFEAWGVFEKEIISGHRFISAHSEWMKAQVKAINHSARICRTNCALRDSFYKGTPWSFSGAPLIFCSAAYPSPFKGLHVAIRSVAILRDHLPNIHLRIAGPHQRPGIRRDGYIAWINREIRRLRLESQVSWLGSLSAPQLTDELTRCSVFVLPTFVESYGVALAEAMVVGVPSVVSFTGGTSFLAKDEDSALFFPPGDEVMCAYQLERLLRDRALAERLSLRAREIALVRNDREQIVRNQVEIYRQVLAEVNGSRQPTAENLGENV